MKNLFLISVISLMSLSAFADATVCGRVSRVTAFNKVSEIEIGIESSIDRSGYREVKETRVTVGKDLRDAALALVSTSQLTKRNVCVKTVLNSRKGYEIAHSIELNMSETYTPIGN